MRRMRFFGLVAMVPLVLGVASDCTRTPPARGLQRVSTRIKWLPGVTYAGSYVARERGYWRQAGLDVEIFPGGFEADPIKLVAAGSNHFGITGAEQLLQARAEGVPIVAIYAELRRSPAGWMALRRSGISRPQQFVGKRVGAQYGTNIEPTLDALLAKLGVDPRSLMRVPVRYDLAPFYSRRVDVMPVYLTGQPILARMQGFDVVTIDPAEYGIEMCGNVYFTSERLIARRPDLVQGFVSGLVRGWHDVVERPEEAVDLMLRVEPSLKREEERAFLSATIPYIWGGSTDSLGIMSRDQWLATRDIMVRYAGLPASTTVESAFTNRFVLAAYQDRGRK